MNYCSAVQTESSLQLLLGLPVIRLYQRARLYLLLDDTQKSPPITFPYLVPKRPKNNTEYLFGLKHLKSLSVGTLGADSLSN